MILAFLVLHLHLQVPPSPPEGWDKVGIVTVLVIAIFIVGTAFLKEWVVPGARYKAKEEECDSYRDENKVLRADNMRLWEEKVEDAKESGELARAIVRTRERDGERQGERERGRSHDV